METCKVCKQTIENVALAIYSPECGGYVHLGHCADYAAKAPIQESGEDMLTETELLL